MRMASKPSRKGALVPLGGPTCQDRKLVRFLAWVMAHFIEEGRTIGGIRGGGQLIDSFGEWEGHQRGRLG